MNQHPLHHYGFYPLLVTLAFALMLSPVAAQALPFMWISEDARVAQTESPRTPPAHPNATDDETQGSLAPAPVLPRPSLERSFFKDLLVDEKAIWTSPRRIQRRDALWLAPLIASTAVLLATDRAASREINPSEDLQEASRGTSRFGSGYATFGAAGTLYVIGRLKHNDRAQEAGLLGSEALIHSSIVVAALKLATSRERPNVDQGQGRFWVGGKSFPSGHAINTWALATVLAQEYPDQPLVRFGAYSLATAVSFSRFTGRNHFPSDVLIGSTLGYLIGRYVVRQHSRFYHGTAPAAISPRVHRPAVKKRQP